MSKHPGQLTLADLSNLPNYTAYARLLIDGMPSRPFSMRTLTPNPADFDDGRAEIVRRTTRHRYASPIESVELRISRNNGPGPAVAIA